MSTPQPPPTIRPPSERSGLDHIISPLARGLSGISQAANVAGTLVVLVLVVAINIDVVSRNLFRMPMRGTYEMVQFMLVMIVFLQLPDVVRTNRMTRSDGLLGLVAGRRPGAARAIARVIDATSAVFLALIVMAVWPEFLRAWRTASFFGTPGIFTAPYWPIHLVTAVSCVLSAAIFATKAIVGRRRPDQIHLTGAGA